jgi:glucokinase
MNESVWVGVDIGGTKTAVVVSAAPPDVVGRIEFATRPADGPEAALRQIRDGIRGLVAQAGAAGIRAIGVSCGSPQDRAAGVILAPPNLPTWVDVPIVSMLEREFQTTARLENDANAGAVAEHRFGAGQGVQNMVFLTMGTGLGGGIIADGRLVHGVTDSAGEIGHVRLTARGPVGYHKAGSVEGWASGGGIAQVADKMVRAAVARGHATALWRLLENGGSVTARDVAEAAQKGDAVARRILASTGRRLGEALAILVDIVNPERIVIGGIAMRLGDLILDPARRVLRREALPHAAAACEVVPACLGERIGDAAALCVAVGL